MVCTTIYIGTKRVNDYGYGHPRKGNFQLDAWRGLIRHDRRAGHLDPVNTFDRIAGRALDIATARSSLYAVVAMDSR